MKKSLSRAVLLVIALLASSLSLVAVSSAPAQAAVATQSHLTSNATNRAVTHGTRVSFGGWVTAGSTCGPCGQGTVHLQRRIAGSTTWSTLSTRDLGVDATPTWSHAPTRTAYYRLYFPGYSNLATASYSASIKVSVRRNLHDNFRRATRTYYGKVTPSYNRRWVTIQKSNCSNPTSKSCRWTTYKAVKTSGTGAWSLRLPVYARRTHFRGYVKASNGYVNGWSNYYVTTYRY